MDWTGNIAGTRRDIVVEYKNKTVVGLTELIRVRGPTGAAKDVLARIDTGATKSSIDVRLAAELQLGPVLKTKLVKSASGTTLRPVVRSTIHIANKSLPAELTIADRSHMKFRVLIGQNIICDNGFLIDPAKGEPGDGDE